MSGALTTSLIAGAATAGLQAFLAPDGKESAQPTAPNIPPPPQVAQAPDVQTVKARNAATGGVGAGFTSNQGTMLTGATGVDASALNVGKNVLLGA